MTVACPFSVNFAAIYYRRGPQYKPFCDLRSVPEASRPWEHVENHRRACTQVFFLCKAELVLSAGQKILLAEDRFLQAHKRAENTKEKSRRCFTCNLFVSHECTDMCKKKKKSKNRDRFSITSSYQIIISKKYFFSEL